jgi:hypothetical protein
MSARIEGYVIVNQHDEYFSCWVCGCGCWPSGAEYFYTLPQWTKDYRDAHVWESRRSAERANARVHGAVVGGELEPLTFQWLIENDPPPCSRHEFVPLEVDPATVFRAICPRGVH